MQIAPHLDTFVFSCDAWHNMSRIHKGDRKERSKALHKKGCVWKFNFLLLLQQRAPSSTLNKFLRLSVDYFTDTVTVTDSSPSPTARCRIMLLTLWLSLSPASCRITHLEREQTCLMRSSRQGSQNQSRRSPPWVTGWTGHEPTRTNVLMLQLSLLFRSKTSQAGLHCGGKWIYWD